MNIGYKDLTDVQKDAVNHYMKMKGYTEDEIPNVFDEISSDSDNALEFLNDDETLEEIIRRFMFDYLEYIIDYKIA